MRNPSPVQTEEFLNCRYKPQGEPSGKLSKRIIGIRLPEDIDTVVRSHPQSAAWLRQVITEAVQRELIKDGES
jgi:hypothetical protein